jgi:HAD superfamily hydrolase (TIGR01509 family)
MNEFLPGLDRYAAVIWDCDGVLIDSEALACAASAEMLCSLGMQVTLDDYLHRFMGKSHAQMIAELGYEGEFPEAELAARQSALFKRELKERELKAISGIRRVLESVQLPMAVASGSSPARLKETLELTGLLGYFKGHLYSAEMVARGKPAPDVFLLAAEKLGVSPRDCLVIEDGRHGVTGAKAAGMAVYAFTGGSHMTPALKQALIDAGPDAIFCDMNALCRNAAA